MLGLTPPTPTEREVTHAGRRVPLWRAMQELAANDRASVWTTWPAPLEQLPVND